MYEVYYVDIDGWDVGPFRSWDAAEAYAYAYQNERGRLMAWRIRTESE